MVESFEKPCHPTSRSKACWNIGHTQWRWLPCFLKVIAKMFCWWLIPPTCNFRTAAMTWVHFNGYTLLVLAGIILFFRTALIPQGIDSTGCLNTSQIFGPYWHDSIIHADLSAAHLSWTEIWWLWSRRIHFDYKGAAIVNGMPVM